MLGLLASLAPDLRLPASWLQELEVIEMDDGGMGSLRLLPAGLASPDEPRFGREAATIEFRDEDGVPVSASLNLDKAGQPFELDMWKVDFSKLRRIPDNLSGKGTPGG